MSIADDVIAIVKNQVQNWFEDDVKPESDLVDDLGCDSLDLVELVLAVEEKFNIEISDQEGEQCKTVQDAITLVERLVKENKDG